MCQNITRETKMAVLDDRAKWREEYEAGWLKNYTVTGEVDWTIYNVPRNTTTVAGPGVALARSRLAVISSGGFYIDGVQEPFDEPDALGRYDIRLLPTDSPPESFSISHTHYDHAAANADRQVLLPTGHLNEMVDAGDVGELAPNIISFMGYQPDVTRVIDESIPAVVEAARAMNVDAAILIPA